MNIIEVNDLKMFDQFYNGSYYTITGAGGDLKEWFDGYNRIFDKERIGCFDTMYTFKGSQMNAYYDLEGDNRYKNDLTFLVIPLDNLNVQKLALIKIKMQDSWFDDVVDNAKNA